jgi:hypothetical protein
MLATVCFLLLCGPALAQEAGQPAAEKSAFVPLFDGKTFAGWEGDQKVFRIEDGAIVGGSLKHSLSRNEFLTTTKDYGDFELRLKFKLLGAEANGGVQIRSQRVAHSSEMCGYQADMGQHYWGTLYDESRRGKTLAGPTPAEQRKFVHFGDWNDYRILCQGRRVQLWVNGKPTVDYTEPDASLSQRGLIGLQIHGGGPTEAWYKDIAIREIAP